MNLRNNNLTTIPPEVGNLTNLNFLSLRNNSLTAIPNEIENLTHLIELSLSGNNLNTIPQPVCDLETMYGTTILIDPGVTCL